MRSSCDDVGVSTPSDDGGHEWTAPVSLPAVRPHRAGTGAVAGSVAAVVVSIVLASVPSDEHGEDPRGGDGRLSGLLASWCWGTRLDTLVSMGPSGDRLVSFRVASVSGWRLRGR